MRHSEYNPPSRRPPHSRLSCMSPPVMLRVAGSPLPFSHVVLVGRSALSVFMLCTCNDIPTLQRQQRQQTSIERCWWREVVVSVFCPLNTLYHRRCGHGGLVR